MTSDQLPIFFSYCSLEMRIASPVQCFSNHEESTGDPGGNADSWAQPRDLDSSEVMPRNVKLVVVPS